MKGSFDIATYMIGLNHKIILAVKFSQSTVIIFQSMLISMTILSKQSLQDHFQTVCSVILSTKLAASDATLQSPKIRGGGGGVPPKPPTYWHSHALLH